MVLNRISTCKTQQDGKIRVWLLVFSFHRSWFWNRMNIYQENLGKHEETCLFQKPKYCKDGQCRSLKPHAFPTFCWKFYCLGASTSEGLEVPILTAVSLFFLATCIVASAKIKGEAKEDRFLSPTVPHYLEVTWKRSSHTHFLSDAWVSATCLCAHAHCTTVWWHAVSAVALPV
jgi:hypothetical protein